MSASKPSRPALIVRRRSTRFDGHPAPSALTTFVRFVAAGVTASVSYGLLFLVLGTLTNAPDLLINLVATVVSTVLSNELHRRFTFRSTERGSVVRGQSAGMGMAVIGLLANSLALAAWNVLIPDAGAVSTLAVVYCVNGAVGLANFLLMRRVLNGRAPQVRKGFQIPALDGLARLAAPQLAGM